MASLESSSYRPGDCFRRFQLCRSTESGDDSAEIIQKDIGDSQGDSLSVNESNGESTERDVDNHPSCSSRSKTTANDTKSKRKRKAPSSTLSSKKAKKWSWTPEVIDVFLKYIKEYKTKCEFNGVDFEVDLASMYTEVRRCMGIDFPDDFGPERVSEPTTELKDMQSAEYELYRKKLDEEKDKIRIGYQRIKEKVKNLRQDYRNAVNKGTRSGSGKVIQENFELLTEIWGGSPATTSLPFGIDGETLNTSRTSSDIEDDGGCEETYPADISSNSSGADTTPREKGKINVSNIAKLVDNKRKHMEKRLSQAQRDQLMMTTARDDIHVKKNMIDAIERSNKTLDESISKMTACLTSIGEGIASGMQMLAMTLANQSHPMNYPQSNYPPQFGNYGGSSTPPPVAFSVSYANRDSQGQHNVGHTSWNSQASYYNDMFK